MKILNVVVCLVLLFSNISLFAQKEYTTDYEIQYELNYSLDSLSLDTKIVEVFYLYSGSEHGVFMNYNTAHKEEIQSYNEKLMQSNTGIVSEKNVSRHTNYKKTIFKYREANQVKVEAQMLDNIYIYDEPAVPLDWKITEETKEYFDYTVQKATTSFAGRDYEAWFTIEIPINDGPYVFYGLPGLIVELYDTKKHYHFGLLSMNKLSNPKTWQISDNVKNLTRKEFKEIEPAGIENLALTENLAEISISNGVAVLVTKDGIEMSQAEFERMLRRYVRNKNNWIEKE